MLKILFLNMTHLPLMFVIFWRLKLIQTILCDNLLKNVKFSSIFPELAKMGGIISVIVVFSFQTFLWNCPSYCSFRLCPLSRPKIIKQWQPSIVGLLLNIIIIMKFFVLAPTFLEPLIIFWNLQKYLQ